MFAIFFFKMENMAALRLSPFSAFTANTLAARKPVRAFLKPEISTTNPKQSESSVLIKKRKKTTVQIWRTGRYIRGHSLTISQWKGLRRTS